MNLIKNKFLAFTLYATPLTLISPSLTADPNASDMKILAKELPGVTWGKANAQKGDFNCEGRSITPILARLERICYCRSFGADFSQIKGHQSFILE